MEQYKLPSHINPDKVFIVNRSELEGRLEPKFYTSIYLENEDKLANSVFPLVSIKDVTYIVSDGTHFTPNYVNEGVKFISVKDVRQSSIDLNNSKFITEQEADFLDKRCKPQKGDILLTKVGTIGLAAVVNIEERFQIFVSLALLRPKSNITPDYLEIFLNSNIAYLQYDRIVKGAGVPDLHLEDIRKIKISLPSLSKQQQIVDLYQEAYNQKLQKEAEARALLDSIDSYLLGELGITLPEKDNSLQKRVFTSLFSEIGGGRLDPLSLKNNISDFLTGKYGSEKMKNIALNFKSGFGAGRQDQVSDDTGIIQIRPTNIDEQGSLKFDRNVYLPADNSYNESDFINVDDILFNNTNSQEWVGKTAILKEQQELLFSNHITKITVNQKVAVPDYIWLILNSYQKNKIFYSICTNWNNQSGVGLDLLRSLPIPLPPLEKQNEIAQHIQSVREQAKQLQNDAKIILEQAKQQVEQMILG